MLSRYDYYLFLSEKQQNNMHIFCSKTCDDGFKNKLIIIKKHIIIKSIHSSSVI